jgi:hypothetical protein
MAVTRAKCMVSHKNYVGPSLFYAWAALSIVCFPESWNHVIELLRLDLGFEFKEKT